MTLTSTNKNIVSYFLLLSVFGLGIYYMLESGSRLRPRDAASEHADRKAAVVRSEQPPATEVQPRTITGLLRENLQSSLGILLLQIIVIIAAARATGKLFIKIKQPAVIGEMVAGILLGPSVLGLLSPATFAFLFPPSSSGSLRLLSQVGVILFMFIVGTELDLDHLRDKAHAAVLVSHAGIIIPFFLGVMLSLVIYPLFAPHDISFIAFALFMGLAMSITAFPVLARIIEERGISRTHLGNVAIACAAVDDLSAWCILGAIVAVVKAEGLGFSLLTIALALLFAMVVIFLIKPQLKCLFGQQDRFRGREAGLFGKVLIFVFASAWFTEIVGIHALFGAFLAGTAMASPSGFRSYLKERLEVCSVLLLPIFFAFTGLRTQINLVDDWVSWAVSAGIIVVAVAGKLGGGMLAARWTCMSWQDAFSIGVLMNTRGLMELIVLNIGYDLGILPARVFSMMVMMALVTTAMTGPLMSAAARLFKRESGLIGSGSQLQTNSVAG
jgi:Kef-type K+ transport system membrane component KefB